MHALKRRGWTSIVLRFSLEGVRVSQMEAYHLSGQERREGHQAVAPSV